MAAFTKEQVELINWLAHGNSIEVCTEVCADLGKMTGYESYNESCNGHFQKRTLFKLKARGLIAEQSHYVMGIHWQRVTLNQKGQTWLANNGGQVDA